MSAHVWSLNDLADDALLDLNTLTPPATAPARRERLAELDALTDQIEPLLDRLDTTWRAVEAECSAFRRRPVP